MDPLVLNTVKSATFREDDFIIKKSTDLTKGQIE